jgi:tripartite-type tricarboxylate transporter receptor subunit TctC
LNVSKRHFLKVLGAAAAVPARSIAQHELDYPTRPVTMIVPFTAGGASDATFRALAEGFTRVTGQPMTVENRPGGGSLVMVNHLKQQKPDGYTLGFMSRAQFASYWVLDGKNAAHPLDDFTFVSAINGSVFALVTRAESPYKTLADVVAAAKANPGKLSVGNIGPGTTHHLTALEFARIAGIDLIYPPFKGESDSNNAALGGHIDMAVSSGSVMPLVEAGRMRVLALATDQRLPNFPNLPTFADQGFPVTMDTTVGVGGPKGMDPRIVAKLDGVFRQITRDPAFNASLSKLYQPVKYMDTASYNRLVRERMQSEKVLVERYNLKQK